MPTFRSVALAALTAWCLVAPSVTALAQGAQEEDLASEEEARSLFEAGRLAYMAGRYEEALDRFEGSYRLTEHALLLYNIGQTAERLRRDERAIEAYEAYLAAVPDAQNRAAVESRLNILRSAERVEASLESGPSTEEDVTSTWWFWTLIGGGVAVIATAIILGVVLSSPGVQEPLAVGPVVFTLEASP